MLKIYLVVLEKTEEPEKGSRTLQEITANRPSDVRKLWSKKWEKIAGWKLVRIAPMVKK